MLNNIINQPFLGTTTLLSNQPLGIAAGCFCALSTIESAIRVITALSDLYNNIVTERSIVGDDVEQNALRDKLKLKKITTEQELLYHAVKTMFFGVCAANPFTGGSLIGALGFLVYAKVQGAMQKNFNDPSLLKQITCFALKILFHFSKQSMEVSKSIVIKVYKELFTSPPTKLNSQISRDIADLRRSQNEGEQSARQIRAEVEQVYETLLSQRRRQIPEEIDQLGREN